MDFRAGEMLLVDKPLRWTSFDVVNKIKWLLKKHPSLFLDNQYIKPRVGHAGTLDPLASGLLIICTGKETKNIESYQALTKEYTGTFVLGATTPCFDLEKPIDQTYPIHHITPEQVYALANQFVGEQEQTPPLFSAIKIDGKRAYELAREGKEAEIKAKKINILSFDITRCALPEVDFKITCSKGTYIRSIARDFGLALQSGAHLSALRRTKIGDYHVNQAHSMESLEHLLRNDASHEASLNIQ